MPDINGLCCDRNEPTAAQKKKHKKAPCGRAQPMGPALVCFSACSTILPFCTSTHHHLHNTIYTTSSTQHHLITLHHQHTIKTTPSRQHHQHNIPNTTSPTQPHQHITIYLKPSTQHHLDNIIHTTPSTLHHHIVAGAALGALPSSSYPFCLIPADTPLVIFFVVACSLFGFVDLFHTWISEDIVNLWGYPVL